MIVSIVSRAWRSTEFRFDGFDFADKATEFEWGRSKAADYPDPGADGGTGQKAIREQGDRGPRARHRIPGAVPIMFVVAELADPSDFHHRPMLRIARENGRVVIHITRCCSIAARAWPRRRWRSRPNGGVPEVHFGWSGENPVTANLHFVLFGTGNVPWMVLQRSSAARCAARAQTAHHRGVRGSELASRKRFLLHDRRKLFG